MKGRNVFALGIMSGTSLDGLDLSLSCFRFKSGKWNFEIMGCKRIGYNTGLKKKLEGAHRLMAEELIKLETTYSRFTAGAVIRFIRETGIHPEVIGYHGHTVFHQPHRGYSVQIGSGAIVASLTGVDTVCDFRSTDVALGGQGAPLVPVGDDCLFARYDACLNLGGIANISFRRSGRRLAFDICPANMILNYLAGINGKAFDKDGQLARSGKIHPKLLTALNRLSYYRKPLPKSTGREWFEAFFLNEVNRFQIPVEDKAATCVEHIAFQTGKAINRYRIKDVLVTGGGTHNRYLISRIRNYTDSKLILPEKNLIDFKEAVIFSFLAVLRVMNTANTLASVTGAIKDSISGALYKG